MHESIPKASIWSPFTPVAAIGLCAFAKGELSEFELLCCHHFHTREEPYSPLRAYRVGKPSDYLCQNACSS